MDSFCKDYSISYTVLDSFNNKFLFLPGTKSVPCDRDNAFRLMNLFELSGKRSMGN
ncbi:hypothetical protein RE474_01005 [Methanolobus sediminis]|uniref:Uncharacterized protein n=1 Tax=Methanolobus sediminis TaxID=3072978 RepID=A0AA51UKN9_9EURY|nr:hypothetical protein [Methanolobus sediminis]WMW25329.1 hypothetical protein RE474_01005 [Methanolobus sediminis]